MNDEEYLNDIIETLTDAINSHEEHIVLVRSKADGELYRYSNGKLSHLLAMLAACVKSLVDDYGGDEAEQVDMISDFLDDLSKEYIE